ncbi:hypothetical protein GCM10009555_009110 [Acrocarpospora macrocephala]|uniref:Uncharacterized protein n=1 Tax=Acrocarpospora macrocephala TaxID=150177 RepID=A0A5M3WNE3_9ACTN|nr:DUF5994 family protein [Acrocarpospora macrocephala]GES10444.1 hypothetical protein Amac_040410 [Acrocarpospora macrocephala]
MTPTILSHLKPLSSVTSAIPAVDSAIRLSLNAVPDRRAAVDGAWWPYSRDAAAELPGLITAVDQRIGRTTLRLSVYADAWDHIPRRIPARGRQVRIGSFQSGDPHVITLILAGAEPIRLLVIPAGTAEGALKLTGFAPADPPTIAHLPAVVTAEDEPHLASLSPIGEPI